MFGLLTSLKRPVQRWSRQVYHRLLQWMRPTRHSLLAGTFTDLTRTKSDLIAENALLRQQLIMLHRQVKRPACTKSDRVLLILLARAVRRWKQALFIVQPDTLLGWHRQAFRWFWRRRSKPASTRPKIPADTVALIQTMARDNRLWGAAQTGHSRLQTHHSKVHAKASRTFFFSEGILHVTHRLRLPIGKRTAAVEGWSR